jgi:uroporphyrinogen decarboxylase
VNMNPRARVLATVRGEPVDRPPIALWRHFPYVDQTADGLASAVVDFQDAYSFDLVKVTHTSGYMAEAWGAELRPADNPEGTRQYIRRCVTGSADWHELRPLTATSPILAREVAAIELVRQAVGPSLFVLPTLFSPLTVAKQLAGELWWDHLCHHPDDLAAGLDRIATACSAFGQACLDHGADGVFFATQLARRDVVTDEQYARFGVPYDRRVIDSVRPRAGLLVLHLHGLMPMFELVGEYGADIVNWHDRETTPSLSAGRTALGRGAVMGGIARNGPIATGTARDAEAEVREAILATGGHRLVVAAGCVILTTTPPENIVAARQAVESLTGDAPVI